MVPALADTPAPYQDCHIDHGWEGQQETCEKANLDGEVLWDEAIHTAVVRQNPFGEFLPHDIFNVFTWKLTPIRKSSEWVIHSV